MPLGPPKPAPLDGHTAKPGGPEIIVEHLNKSFGEKHVLRDINLSIRRSELLAIVGTSGGGKTVLLDHLTGLMRPDSGRVLVADHSRPGQPLVDLAEVHPDSIDQIRLYWAIVFQRNALFGGTVFDNIALWFREHTKLPEEKIRLRAQAALKAAALEVNDVIDKDRDALSGGMAKRVAIARAIAIDPAVIFYDEPTTGLDPVVSGHIHELIWNTHNSKRADGQPRTSIIVTHDKELLRRISPRIIMLDQGNVVFDGPYEKFRTASVPAAKLYLEQMPALHAREAH
ncbi:MAG: ABC transporter ATP-binding protein [Phycisphaerales bacterium]